MFIPKRKHPQEPQDARPQDSVTPQTKSVFEQIQNFARTTRDRFVIQPIVRTAEAIFEESDKSTFARTRGQQIIQERRKTKTQFIDPSSTGKTAAATSASIPTGDPSVFKIEPRRDLSEFLPDNVLNDYINIQYHLVLTMLPDRDLAELQTLIPQASNDTDDILQLNKEIGGVTIASTGDVFANETTDVFIPPVPQAESDPQLNPGTKVQRDVKDRNYYNIKSLTLDNVFSPSKNNPGISQMITAEMSLVEPHGFRLVEDIRRIADRIGYANINLGRVVYRLDIFFSGYNTEEGVWVPNISLDPRRSVQQDFISYFINLTTMSAKVESNGTNYTLGLTPAGHVSFRPEEIILEANSIAAGAKKADGGGVQTFGGFIDNLCVALNDYRRTRSNQQIKRTYKIWAPDILRQQKFYSGEFLDRKGLLSDLPNGQRVISIGKDMGLTDVMQAALEDLPFVQEQFLADKNNESFLVPKIHWTVRYNAIYENKNPQLNDYDNIRLEYIIEPYVTYKKATIENKEQAANVVNPIAQSNRVEAMIRLGMIARIYDYIHTSENTEVKDLDLDFKLLYYTAMNTSKDTPTGGGISTAHSASDTANKRKEKNELNQPTRSDDDLLKSIIDNDDPRVDSALQRIFGQNKEEAAGDGQNETDNPFNTKHGGMGELPKDDYGSANFGADDPQREKYKIYFKDYTENDLLLLNGLEIRGDPVWLLSPYANISLNTLTAVDASRGNQTETTRTNLFQPHAAKVIFLKMFEPLQDDLMNPNRRPAGFGRNVFGGFYEIYTVKSTFEGGKFIQKLSGGKIDHLNYVEQQFRKNSRGFQSLAPTRPERNPIPQQNDQPNEAAVAVGDTVASEFFTGA